MLFKKIFSSLLLVSPSKVMGLDSIKGAGKFLGDVTGEMTPSLKKKGVPARVESFGDAINRLGLDQERLQERRRELLYEARMMYGLFMLALGGSFYFSLSSSWNGVFACACAMLVGASGGLTKAFRVYQIDIQELCDFRSFLKQPGEWVR